MKKTLFSTFLLSLLLVSCQSGTSNNGEEQAIDTSPIKIGLIAPLTGDFSSFGTDVLNAVTMRVNEFNAAGGVSGRTVKLIAEDGRCDGTAAASSAQKLVSIDNVVAIVGGQCSGETLAAAPIVEAAGVFMVSPVSSSPDVTDAGDYIFRVYPSDALKSKAFANVFTARNLSKIAFISENTDFCQAVRSSVEQDLPDGTEIVFSEFVEPGTKDFRSILTRLQNVDFDTLIVNVQTDPVGAALLTQFRELGFDQIALGTDTTDSLTLFELAEGALDNFYVVSVPPYNEESGFAKRFVEQFGPAQYAMVYAAHGYDSTSVILEGLKAVGPNGSALRDFAYNMPTYSGESGSFRFDENGDALGFSFSLKEFKDGEILEVEKIPLT